MMAVHLIVIGDNPNSRMPALRSSPAEASVRNTVLGCQPCHRTRRFQVGLVCSGAPATLQTIVSETGNKPAETYVLEFDSDTDAIAWIHANKDDLCGKHILLHDPSIADPA
jgi:hypothetical protein